MPFRPKRSCNWPGCGELIDRGFYCAKHRSPRPPDSRPNAGERGYDAGYRRVRARVLKRDPICRLQLPGCTEKSTIAHHDPPHVPGQPHDEALMVGVCRNCHEVYHGRKL